MNAAHERQGAEKPLPRSIVNDADVRSFAAKLKGLYALLTTGEQALLHAVLRRAARGAPTPESEETAWGVPFNPFPYLDAVVAEEARAASRSDSPGHSGHSGSAAT